MTKILACFKMVSLLEDLTEDDWRREPGPREDYARPALSPEDESALELALRLGEALGAPPSALTIGGDRSDRQAASLLALGFKSVTRLEPWPPEDLRFRPEAVSSLIKWHLAKNPTDIILAGRRSSDGQNGLAPQYLAEALNWPLAIEVRAAAASQAPGFLTVASSLDDALLTREIRPPVVLAVGDAPGAFLRVPTLKARLAAKNKAVTVIKVDSASLPPPLSTPSKLTREVSSRQARALKGDSAEIARGLLAAIKNQAAGKMKIEEDPAFNPAGNTAGEIESEGNPTFNAGVNAKGEIDNKGDAAYNPAGNAAGEIESEGNQAFNPVGYAADEIENKGERVLSVLFAGLPGGEHAARAEGVKTLLAGADLVPETIIILHLGAIGEADLLADLGPAIEFSPRDQSQERRLILAKIIPEELDDAASFLGELNFDLAVITGGAVGAHLCGRLAAKLQGTAALEAESLELKDGNPLITKMVYAQNLKAAIPLSRGPCCVTPSASLSSRPRKAQESEPKTPGRATESVNLSDSRGLIERLDFTGRPGQPKCLTVADGQLSFVNAHQTGDMAEPGSADQTGSESSLQNTLAPFESSGDLAEAEALVIGGAGLGGPDGIKLMASVAEALGAKWGVTRPAALSAWAPLSKLVGVSGAMTSPKWCLVLGASGAAAFYAGIAKAGLIASVNTAPEAPVVTRSDLLAVADAKDVLTEMAKLLGILR